MMEGILYTLKNYQGLQRVFVYMDNIFICIVLVIKMKKIYINSFTNNNTLIILVIELAPYEKEHFFKTKEGVRRRIILHFCKSLLSGS